MSEILRSGEQRIRDDLAVEFVFDGEIPSLDAQWTPRPPSRLSAGELDLYRQRRNEFLERVAEQTGLRTLVVDL